MAAGKVEVRMLRSFGRMAGVAVLTAAVLTGCLGEGSCSSTGTHRSGALAAFARSFGPAAAYASCAAGVEYQDRFYVAWSDKLPVAKGHLLGDAVYPTCDDGGGCADGAEPRPTRVWAMRGVDPEQVVIGRMEGSDRFVVYARPDADPDDYFRFAGGRWHLRLAPGAGG